jgi:GNAT superfamily N-acetyltransferase
LIGGRNVGWYGGRCRIWSEAGPLTGFAFRPRNAPGSRPRLAVGALKQLTDDHAELKSMHTAARARGRGLGGAILCHLVGMARDRGVARVSLETGSMEAFAPARSLYARAGFTPCEPFGAYRPSPSSTFMTLAIDGRNNPVHAA